MAQVSWRSADAAWAAQLIRQARARLGFDVRWGADMLGVTPSYLFMVETGMAEPSVSFCRRVVTAFNMPQQEAVELLAAVGAQEEAKQWQKA